MDRIAFFIPEKCILTCSFFISKETNKIATSDLDDTSHLEKMNELFSQGVIDAFEDDVLSELVTNSKLWDDLEL